MTEDENRALFASAIAHHQAGRSTEAMRDYQTLLARNPNVAAAHNNLGMLLDAAGEHLEAEQCFRAALALRPSYPEALNNLGAVLRILRRSEEAIICFRQSLVLRPDNVDALVNLGDVLRELHHDEEAMEIYARARALRPNDFRIHKGFGRLFTQQGLSQEAITALTEAARLKPDSLDIQLSLLAEMQAACDWSSVADRERAILSRLRAGHAVDPYWLLTTAATSADQMKCAALHAASFEGGLAPRRVEHTSSKIRLGYLSGDYRDHPIAYLIAALIELHDRDTFDVIGYSLGPNENSYMRPRLEKAFDRFVDLESIPDEEAARMIADDGVDILIDVSGYTRFGRPRILALRPAPIQINYLAYPGTMGATFMDYIIADREIVPDRQHHLYSEKVIYLPDCYQPNDNGRLAAPQTPSRKDCALPEDAFVFCGINRTVKITPVFFDIWMKLLREVPGSVLWLLLSNHAAVVNLRREAQVRGVDPNRIVFAPIVPLPEHLARLGNADLFLDTLPYNAHTTMSDALWIGLPAVTCRGDTFAGRVGASLLRAVSLPELIAETQDEYYALALSLARDSARLGKVRTHLIQSRASLPLFDSRRYTANIEKAYTHMMTLRRAGRQPESFSV